VIAVSYTHLDVYKRQRAAEHRADVLPFIRAAQKAGAISLREIARALTARGIQPPGGGEMWHARQVSRILGAADADAVKSSTAT